MNPFEQYAKAAHTRVSQPQALIGPIKTRGAARTRYSEIVDEMNACEDADALSGFLSSVEAELLQYRIELEFYWEGDGDFVGLAQEIERAKARCDGDAGTYTGNWS